MLGQLLAGGNDDPALRRGPIIRQQRMATATRPRRTRPTLDRATGNSRLSFNRHAYASRQNKIQNVIKMPAIVLKEYRCGSDGASANLHKTDDQRSAPR
jgi:hypothetical protein